MNWKLEFEHNIIKVMFGEKQKVINKHMLVEVFFNFHIGETKANWAKISNAIVALVEIIDKVPNIYNTNEGWVVKNMRLEFANKIATILPIIYQKDKVQYFINKSTMMIIE
jgi:hypothetical protein